MKLPSDVSGQALVDALCRHWGYAKVNQVGSHIVVQTQDPTPHRVAIPAHKALRVGTLNGILRSVANHKVWTGRTLSNRFPDQEPAEVCQALVRGSGSLKCESTSATRCSTTFVAKSKSVSTRRNRASFATAEPSSKNSDAESLWAIDEIVALLET